MCPLRSFCTSMACLFLLVGLPPLRAQDTGAGKVTGKAMEARWEAGACAGFLAPHRVSMRALITEHARGGFVTWTAPARGLWSCSRSRARWGFIGHIGRTGAPDHIGHQAALLGLSELMVGGRWRFRLAGGIGWTEKTWSDADADTRQRIVIGSPINGSVQVGFHRPAITAGGHWSDRIGLHLTLDHQSNASFTQPNLGTNVMRFGLSTAWAGRVPAPKAVRDTLVVLDIIPPPVNGWQWQFAVGRRQPGPLDPRETAAEVGLDYRWGGGLRWGGIIGTLGMSRPGHFGWGWHAGAQLRFTRVQVDLVHGRYIVRWQDEEAHYMRTVFQWHLSKAWWARIALHTHGFRAHHPTFGIGFVPGGKRPYGRY